MSRHRAAGWLVVMALLAAACGGGDDDDGDAAASTTTTTAAATTTTAVAAGPVVEVHDAGSEPRHELRFAPEVGTEQALTMRQRQFQRVTVQGTTEEADIPWTEFDLRYRIVSVEPGRIVADLEYEDTRVVAEPDTEPAVVESIESVLAAFRGATAQMVFDERGRVLEFSPPRVDVAGETGAFLSQFTDSLAEQASLMAIPFPEDPVGVGARWTVTTGAELAGLPMRIAYDVGLREVSATAAAADLGVTLTFVPGTATIAGTPATVESGTMKGSGAVGWEFGAVVPLSEQTIEGTTVISVHSPRGAVRVEQFQRQTIVLQPR